VNTDTTEWTVCHDRTNLKTYVRTYGGLRIQAIDLNRIDFTRPGLRVIELEGRFLPEDVTAKCVPLE